MSYVDSVLQPGEVVLGRTRLHWFIYLRSLFLLLLALGVYVAATGVAPENELYFTFGALALGASIRPSNARKRISPSASPSTRRCPVSASQRTTDAA